MHFGFSFFHYCFILKHFFFLEHPRKISLKVFKGKVCTTADSWVSLLAFVFISKHVGLCDEDD